MKSTVLIIGFFIFASLFSCKKDQVLNISINNIRNNQNNILLAENDINSIKSLFEFNNLKYHNYQFFRIQSDELGNHHVSCHQFINNLRVFSNDLIFHFNKANIFYFMTGDTINNTFVNAEPIMREKDVVQKFLIVLNSDKSYTAQNTITNPYYEIELGYYVIDNINNSVTNLVKVWKINPKDKEFPMAYINDLSSATIHYDNGLRN